MLRTLQGHTGKPLPIYEAGEAMTRGCPITIDYASDKVYKATENTGVFLAEVAYSYDGINAVVAPSDADFEPITKGQKVICYPNYVGESFATSEVAPGTMVKGAYIKAVDGKFVAASAGEKSEWVYGGSYSDPTGIEMWKITRTYVSTI